MKDIILEPLASSEAVLSQEEKDALIEKLMAMK